MNGTHNRVREALREEFNVLGVAGAVALSAATLSPGPLLVGVVAEAAYLLFVPDTRWYAARAQRRADAVRQAQRARLKAEVYPQLAPAVRERFERLEGIREQLGAQSDLERQEWFRQVLRRLDYLLEKFLTFAVREARFEAYLLSVYRDLYGRPDDALAVPTPARRPGNGGEPWAARIVRDIQDAYEAEAAEISARRDDEQDAGTRAVLEKRAEVLQQRREYVGKIGRILTNLGHQMGLLEDSFGLINDQIRARSPEQVLADIEGVVCQTDGMMQLLEELAPYDDMARRLAA